MNKLTLTIILLIPILTMGQTTLDKIKRSKEISFYGQNICEQEFRAIGTINFSGDTYYLYGVTTDFGNSCKRNTKMVITSPDKIIGYWTTPELIPSQIIDNKLKWTFEDGSNKWTSIGEIWHQNFELLPKIFLSYNDYHE